MRGHLKIRKHKLGGNGTEAYYTEHPRPALLALEPSIGTIAAKARVVEAEGYARKRPPKGGRKFCFAPRYAYDYDSAAISAIRSVIDEIRPSWVSEVKEASRMSNDPRWIAAYCEMSPQLVIAILLNLGDRDELPEEAETA